MSDDTTAGSGEQNDVAVEHQSIVSRLLEYQRQLREGDPPPPPVATLPDRPTVEPVAAEASSGEDADLVDLTEAEEEIAPVVRLAPPASWQPATNDVWAVPEPPGGPEVGETAERMAELEDALRRVSETITELRQRFQDMAVASDERLAELEQIVERARRSPV